MDGISDLLKHTKRRSGLRQKDCRELEANLSYHMTRPISTNNKPHRAASSLTY